MLTVIITWGMIAAPIWQKLTAGAWIFFGLEFAVTLFAWWRLGSVWRVERRHGLALITMLLLTVNVSFGFYERYALERLPFSQALRIQGNYDAIGWLLAIGALIPTIRWRRHSKQLSSALAFALAMWLCFYWTLAIGLS